MLQSYISMTNCIIRSDFNLVTSLVCYFYWNSRQSKPKRIANLISMILLVVSIFDVIWLISIWSYWTSSDFVSTVWQQLRAWRITIIILSLINLLLKGATVFAIYLESKNELPYQKLTKDGDKSKELL